MPKFEVFPIPQRVEGCNKTDPRVIDHIEAYEDDEGVRFVRAFFRPVAGDSEESSDSRAVTWNPREVNGEAYGFLDGQTIAAKSRATIETVLQAWGVVLRDEDVSTLSQHLGLTQ